MAVSYDDMSAPVLAQLLIEKEAELAREREAQAAQHARDLWLAELDKTIRNLFGAGIDAFSQQVLHTLVQRFPCLVAGLYSLSDPERRNAVLHLQGTYGMTMAQATHPTLQLGEGLPGECARTGQAICHPIDPDAPFAYTERALVPLRPKAVYLQPLSFNGLVVGVLELYTVDTLPEGDLQLLQSATQSIAAALAAMLKQSQVQQLLRESQLLVQQQKTAEEELRQNVEEMQSQEEELRQNMEELQATQEEMARLQDEMQAELDAINRSMCMVEFDPYGHVLNANLLFQRAVGYTLEELRGQHHRLLMPEGEGESEAYTAFWERLRQGEFQMGEYRRVHREGKPVWLYATYNPVLDRNGNVTRILKFASDITARKQQEVELVRMDQLEDALEEVRAREAEIQRLLKVTQYNEQQLQDVEQSYRSTIAQLSLRVKQLEGELASSQAVAS